MKQDTNPTPTQPSIAELISTAHGHWAEILDDAGIPKSLLDGGAYACPLCGGWDRFSALPNVEDRGVVCCRQCFLHDGENAFVDGITTLQWIIRTDLDSACRWLADWLGFYRPDSGVVAPRKMARYLRDHVDEILEELPDDRSLASISVDFRAAMTEGKWREFSKLLDLPIETLERIGVGWSQRHGAITWPMTDEYGRVVGIGLLYLSNGKETSLVGEFDGMIMPTGVRAPVHRLYIAEGGIDTAALLSLGISVIGRPLERDETCYEIDQMRALMASDCVVVASQGKAGRDRANHLADALLEYCRTVRVLVLPAGYSSVREWVRSGITAADVDAAVCQAQPRRLWGPSQK
ncbi:primase-helicase zinc-binding domain-containing protein [Allorhodopirellula solitaria]|uniref:DNA primase/helicase Gp4 N-terminal Bacteriophage T7-like domain-containing protein n=1 Tax=Allorhodopirellula solitaria TaxID=2527987 RepID=A0A5C5X0Y7_9BACT|nr:primase-helicase zinc-binding domain-containing protein [Allorhodopirellula solitaria]TWT56528.1 hypothetical protein CA85_40610 [Allorhodopirellula solitaria]